MRLAAGAGLSMRYYRRLAPERAFRGFAADERHRAFVRLPVLRRASSWAGSSAATAAAAVVVAGGAARLSPVSMKSVPFGENAAARLCGPERTEDQIP
jgi:hypothetical protein